jgi:hypothetical protein
MEPDGGGEVEKSVGSRSGRTWPENGPERRRRRSVIAVTMMMKLHQRQFKK